MEPITAVLQTGDSALFSLWENYWVFIAIVVFAVGAIGMASGSMSIAAVGSYITFVWLGVETGEQFLQNIVYVSLALVFVGFAFKVWRMEGPGGQEA